MPANIFAKTGTHVSILFLSNQNDEDVLLVDASKYGKQFKDGDFKKTILSSKEEEEIIEILNQKKVKEEVSVVVSSKKIIENDFSLVPGQYFNLKISYKNIAPEEFSKDIDDFEEILNEYMNLSRNLSL